MIDRLFHVAHSVIAAGVDHPVITGGVSAAAGFITVMQSAQEVVGTIVALIGSITALVTAAMALRGAFKKKAE
jgi:hypothetical protein